MYGKEMSLEGRAVLELHRTTSELLAPDRTDDPKKLGEAGKQGLTRT